ncbi:MAG: menE [Bacteroidetes bacterium]|nr:menE [Bacteroidota bacterium]
MDYQFDRNKQQILIEGKAFSRKDFKGKEPSRFFASNVLSDLYVFLHEWFNDEDFVWVKTSGSTGTPKPFKADKMRMMQSAGMTCSFLGLTPGSTALLCMKMDYIAGKMVVVRSLIAGLNLIVVATSGNPLREIEMPIDFAALVPLQVYNSLQNPAEKEKLANIRHLIIGGGAIDEKMAGMLKSFPNAVYSTYGMTETLSHIALRRLSGNHASEFYTPLEGVKLSISAEGTLIVEAPRVSSQSLTTNDMVELHPDQQFKILGRKDNIINSGGIKIQIEEVERLLRPLLGDSFAITSLPDPKFGEIVVLATTESVDEFVVKTYLPAYYQPKSIIRIEKLPFTETGKIERRKLKELVKDIFSQ